MRKIRVLHYCNQLSLGGTEKTMHSFCRHLDPTEFEVFAASWFKKIPFKEQIRLKIGAFFGHSKSQGKLQSLGQRNARAAEFQDLLGGRLFFLSREEDLTQILQKYDIDILHIHTSGRAEFPANNETIMSLPRAVVTTNQFELQNDSRASRFIGKILFVSHWLKDNKASWSRGDARADVLYNPIEMPSSNDGLREALRIPSDAFVFGRVGRADPGIHDPISLRAYKKIETDKTYFLALSAPLPMIQEAKKLELRNFISLPATADPVELSRFYNSIDVLAHARKDGETFGLNIAEAMIHGKPVVSHLCSAMNAQIEVIGSTGFVVEQDDVNSYASKLSELMKNRSLYADLSAAAKRRAETEFEANQLTQKLTRIYRDLLRTKP